MLEGLEVHSLLQVVVQDLGVVRDQPGYLCTNKIGSLGVNIDWIGIQQKLRLCGHQKVLVLKGRGGDRSPAPAGANQGPIL